jgi:hypothetical protein
MNLAGIRIDARITCNDSLLRVVKKTSMCTAVPAIVQKAAARLLNDTGMCSHMRYIQTFLEQGIKNSSYLNPHCILFHISVTSVELGGYSGCFILNCCLFYF